MAVGAVHEVVCGRPVASTAAAPEPLTKRFTARLRRLVAGREAAIEAIDDALRLGRLDQAARQLDDLASDAGNDGACALRRARLAALQQDPVMVLRWARSAVNQGVADPLALALLGLGHLLQGEPATAVTVFNRLIAEHPEALAGYAGLAAACALTGRLPQMDGALVLARERDASAAVRRLEACRARLAGDAASEEAILAQLLREAPDDQAAATRLRVLRRGDGSGNTRRHTASSHRNATHAPETGALVRRPTDPGS
jgi:predicted Zn-dependent protease